MTSTLAYSTNTSDENRLRIARVAAAGRVMADRAREQRAREHADREAATIVAKWIAEGFTWFGVKADVYPDGSIEGSYRMRDRVAMTHCDECRTDATSTLAYYLYERDVSAEVWAYDDEGRYSDVI